MVVDEAYVDFGAQTAIALVDKYPNLLVVQTLSKSRSLAGMRVGLAVGHKDLIDALDRVKNSFNSYPLDRIAEAASTPNEIDLYQAQLDLFLDPNDPKVIEQARIDGIPDAWMAAARQSPVYKMAVEWKVALPLHPEYRTLPMVWYVPPLSPITASANAGMLSQNGEIPDVSQLRIPVKYLANLLTAGDTGPVVRALERMLAMRSYQRAKHVDGLVNQDVLDQVGLTAREVEEMYRYMAIANYEDRFVIPTTHREYAENTFNVKGGCGFSFGNGCSEGETEISLFGSEKKRTIPIKLEA